MQKNINTVSLWVELEAMSLLIDIVPQKVKQGVNAFLFGEPRKWWGLSNREKLQVYLALPTKEKLFPKIYISWLYRINGIITKDDNGLVQVPDTTMNYLREEHLCP